MLLKIKWTDVADALEIDTADFPKYARPLLNLANQYAQATRPRIVGQMSELIEEFPGSSVEEWEKWYAERHPGAMNEAVDRIAEKLDGFRKVLDEVDREMIHKWVRDLVICKTYRGMRFQAAILPLVAAEMGAKWRRATPEEESAGVDGCIGGLPVSIKPETYEGKHLQERIAATMIIYEETDSHLVIQFEEDALK